MLKDFPMSTLAISSTTSSCLKYIPLYTPALKEDSYKVDYDLLRKRIFTVFLACMGTLFGSLALASVYPVAISFMPLSIAFLILLPLDSWVANKTADRKAVNEYLQMEFPSRKATERIQYHYSAAKLFIQKNGNVNKLNEEGQSLLHCYGDSLNIFKLLVDHGADVKRVSRYNIPYFQDLVMDENPAFLEYVLKTNRVRPTDFTTTQQVKFWTDIGSATAAYLLKQYGFDINARDEEGYTPLLRFVKNVSSPFFLNLRHLGITEHVRILLQYGADSTMTVLDNGVEKNALALNTNPAIQRILQT